MYIIETFHKKFKKNTNFFYFTTIFLVLVIFLSPNNNIPTTSQDCETKVLFTATGYLVFVFFAGRQPACPAKSYPRTTVTSVTAHGGLSKPVVIANAEGSRTTPSVVFIKGTEKKKNSKKIFGNIYRFW